MSYRREQIESTILRAVRQVLARGLADPRAGGMITVTAVELTGDLKTANVMISVYPEAKQDLTMHALHDAAAHIRHEAGELVALKQMPQVAFKLDLTLKRQAEVVRALSKAAADRETRGTGP